MLERFVKEARAIVVEASEAALRRGASTAEAEHLLLALADSDGTAGAVLADTGLDPDGVEAALEAELERSLAAVGVSVGRLDPPSVPATGTIRWGSSAKTALERALEAARDRGDRRIEPGHILLAVLAAREGTVPRALRGAGVDPEDLALRTHAALDAA